jgi:hypothetical protein
MSARMPGEGAKGGEPGKGRRGKNVDADMPKAQASLAEVGTKLDVVYGLNHLDEPALSPLLERRLALGKQLYRLGDALRKRA